VSAGYDFRRRRSGRRPARRSERGRVKLGRLVREICGYVLRGAARSLCSRGATIRDMLANCVCRYDRRLRRWSGSPSPPKQRRSRRNKRAVLDAVDANDDRPLRSGVCAFALGFIFLAAGGLKSRTRRGFRFADRGASSYSRICLSRPLALLLPFFGIDDRRLSGARVVLRVSRAWFAAIEMSHIPRWRSRRL